MWCVRHILRNEAECQLLQSESGKSENWPKFGYRQAILSAIDSASVVSLNFTIY